MVDLSKGTAVITGASSGIGAVYARRLAKRGYDLILVARNLERMNQLAAQISSETDRLVLPIVADLTNGDDLERIEQLLKDDTNISLLVNNAGFGAGAPLLQSDVEQMTTMIELNITALTRLTYAAIPGFVERGGGTLINISSIVAIAPEVLNGVYGGSKAFVLAFSQSLQRELVDKVVRVQAVLPGAIATEFWDILGNPVSNLPNEMVMSVSDLVDAALAGLDAGELVTVPSLPDLEDWTAYENARQRLVPNLSRSKPAARYL